MENSAVSNYVLADNLAILVYLALLVGDVARFPAVGETEFCLIFKYIDDLTDH